MFMRYLVAALVSVVSLASACAGQDGPAATPQPVPAPTASARTVSTYDYVGVWTGPDGQPAERGQERLRAFEMASRRMPDHCGWEKAVVLQVPQPLGSTYSIGSSVRIQHYTRDADGVLRGFEDKFRGDLDLQAQLPGDARATGFSLGDIELWLGQDQGEDYVYLVRPGAVERWPANVEPIPCA